MSDDTTEPVEDTSAAAERLAQEIRRLRTQAGLSQSRLAVLIGYTPAYVSLAERPSKGLPSAAVVQAIDNALGADGALVGLREHAESAHHKRRRTAVSAEPGSEIDTSATSVKDIQALAREIQDSDTADDAIARLARAVTSLAESHTRAPAQAILKQVFGLHNQARILLGGRQRLSQRRELFRIESDTLAHACLVLDDLGQNQTALQCGNAALACAIEAGSNEAIARSALAKALRWSGRLIESADMATIGHQCSPDSPIRAQLASQEANASALLGDTTRAREALRRSRIAAENVPADSGTSAWSFPVGRQAIFALSVALEANDPDAALDAAATADASWTSGQPAAPANWAQIRIGSGIAHLSKGSLDAAIEDVTPVFNMPTVLRISTVTAYMERLARHLEQPWLMGNKDAAALRQRIHEFNSVPWDEDALVETE